MNERLALIGIIVENKESVQSVNELLHEYGSYIVGRMGIPYKDRKVNIISIVMDAPSNEISSLGGKLGKLEGVNVKTIYAKAAK